MLSGTAISHGDPIAPVILGVTGILAFAVVGRVAARRLNQPTVLGELLMGIVLGNLGWYFGVDLITVLREGQSVFEIVNRTLSGVPLGQAAVEILGPEAGTMIARIMTDPLGGQVMQVAQAVDVFSRYGVIFLLFMVGLNIDVDEMKGVGKDSLRVAFIGVAMPLALGYLAVWMLRPELSIISSIFIAATLGATSIGITANVLEEMDRASSREGHIILGAAIGDDILGLIILAVVSGIVVSGSVDLPELVTVVFVSTLFLVAAAALGPRIVKMAAKILGRLDIVEAKMFTSYLFVMILAWMANLAGLATIIGAFAAGVILHDSFFARPEDANGERVVSIRELIMPLEVILVPIFFILMGMQVKIETFLSWPVITLAAGLLVAAIIGKLASGLGASRPASKLVVGIGMLPRGEVGLVFALIGRTLDVISDSIFAAVVMMVFVTTLIAPTWLKFTLSRQATRESGS